MPGLRFMPALGLAVALGGCSLLPFGWIKPDRPVVPRPASMSSASALSNGDAYYDRAVSAIARRDYALALDLLQRARAQDASDVRVLNAFGVVYDKLGRFDLSARYYGQALQLEPASRVVAENLAYSHQLQGLTPASPVAFAGLADAPFPQPSPANAPQVAIAAAPVTPSAPAVMMVETPSLAAPVGALPSAPVPVPVLARADAASPPPPRSPGLMGRPLDLENASGRPALTAATRRHLTSRGWTSPRLSRAVIQPQARTTISFPESRRTIALALSRTLPGPARLTPCATPCEGVRLTLGADARTWRLPPPAEPLGPSPARRS
ncbi:hypothetical protein D8I30_01065 [Brevundimonas naejangsanensis]|uniref:LytR/CpsA/Psr regulator C-terminal domain-containing protein n=1 Tax=Brevundimonas naejangsanensis TaxID=588932 RepID=A0A494RCU1_9CAUL|nr:LytR C-terminal domain-containing protein [Brevundimonas naejangsanensis]AYG93931.1 hypothetical protein D8I30_01065 [Brevundimonas naejangsanensis]